MLKEKSKIMLHFFFQYKFQSNYSDGQIFKHNYYKIHNEIILRVYEFYKWDKILISSYVFEKP